MMYSMVYAISKGLTVCTTAMMCKRALQLGGIHIDQLFKLPYGSVRVDAHRRAELAIIKLLGNPKKLDFMRSVDILFFDEMGQVSSLMLSILDMILRKVRHNNIFMGGVLLIFSMDHTQIQPIDGRPFLTSAHIISCFKTVELQHSVRASSDSAFQEIQKISRYPHSRFLEEPELVEKFVTLCSEHLTFVENWDDDRITPTTMRLYSKRIPAREASQQFVAGVMRDVHESVRITCTSEDCQKNRHSRIEWGEASERLSIALEQKVKEPRHLLFFQGATYEITHNSTVPGEYSNTQLAVLFDLPSRDDLLNWRKIKILKAPVGCRSVGHPPGTAKDVYLQDGFVEISIGICPDRTHSMSYNMQAKRKQYGLKHHVTSTIHAAMGDTLYSMATEISSKNDKFKMWDKGQMIVILSRTHIAMQSIFVGDKRETLRALKELLIRKTQWTDYMEMILEIITVRESGEMRSGRSVMNTDTFPYRICDMSLPQCNTGYVYMLLSLEDKKFVYIGMTNSIRERIKQHNSGVGSVSTEPLHLRPYALLAYICGFDLRTEYMQYIEQRWKFERDQLIKRGINDPISWAEAGGAVIDSMNANNDGEQHPFKLVCMFEAKKT